MLYMFAWRDKITAYRVRPWMIRYYKWVVDRQVAETNRRYGNWLLKRDEVRLKQHAKAQSSRYKLFGTKPKRRV